MKHYFDKEFDLRYFEMNENGVASPTTMLTLLEETAADHCYSIGHSLYDLLKQNVGWVLLSGTLQMDRYPRYKEKITIRTWISSYKSIRGFRENVIYDAANNIIGKAKGLWVFYDIQKKRPAKIWDEFKNKWPVHEEDSITHNITQKIQPIESISADINKQFNVNLYDTDTNEHVNNIRYLQWLMESLPEHISNEYYLHSIDGRFITEAQYGDTIISSTVKGEEENSFIHTIKTKDDHKVCATGKTFWKKIEK